jgi:hypothetical protein
MSRVARCEVRSREKMATKQNKKKKKSTMVSRKKKRIVMNPILHRIEKRSSPSGQNSQLVH